MQRLAMAFSGLILLAFAGGAGAHHGWGSYDAGTTVVLEGEVVELHWSHPHVMLYLMHDGARWEAVLAPPTRMSVRGLSEEVLAVGATVRLEGYASRHHAHELRAERINVNGSTFELR